MKMDAANKSNSTVSAATESYDLLERAVQELSARCDYAASLDGAGFNRFDSGFGHHLASTSIEDWSARQLYAAHRMLRKYRKQLTAYGVDYDTIPTPPKPADPKPKEVKVSPDADTARKIEYDPKAKLFYVSFGKDTPNFKSVLQQVKTGFQGRTFDWETKRWMVTGNGNNALFAATLVEEWNFVPSKQAEEGIRNLSTQRSDTVTVKGNTFRVNFGFNRQLWDAIQRVPLTSRKDGEWIIKADVGVVESLQRLIAEFDLDADDEVFDLCDTLVSGAIGNIEGSRLESAELDLPTWIKGTPYPFQLAGIKYGLDNRRVLIADEMGLGKTAQALLAAVLGGAKTVVIVCPASVKYNWAKEIYNWFGDKWTASVIEGRKGDKRGEVTVNTWHGQKRVPINEFRAKFLIVTYSVLSYHVKTLREKVDAFIADESHYLKNDKAKRSKAAVSISKKAKYTFLLTGTPIKNRPVEFVNQLKILGVLPDFGGAYDFKIRYCNPQYNGYGYTFDGASNLEELNMKLRAKCMVRRLKKDVMTELPPITHTEVPMEIDNRKRYNRADANPIQYIYEEALNDTELWNEIAALLRDAGMNYTVKELVEERALDKANRASRAEHLVRIALLRKLAGQGKMENVVAWIEDFLESDEKLIVFAVHRAIQKELLQRFPDAAHVLGDDPGKVRQEQVDRFQNDPDCRLIVCSLYAASEGITLHAASNVAFVQQGWTPAEREQAIARAHRIGQDSENVSVWYLEATDTVEQEIAALIEKKAGYLQKSADGDITAETEYVSTLKQLIHSTTQEDEHPNTNEQTPSGPVLRSIVDVARARGISTGTE